MSLKPLCVVVSALALTCTALGQPLELDTGRLMSDPQVTPATLTDGIWTITPPAGRRLYLLPLRLPTKVAQPLPLETHTKLTGGQFVGWYIPQSPKAKAQAEAQAAPRQQTATPTPPFGAFPPGLRLPQTLPNGQPIPESVRRQLESGQIPENVRQEMQRRGISLPQGLGGAGPTPGPTDLAAQYDKSPPRFAREAGLLADGQITWKLARGVPNAQVTSKNHLYGFMVSREAMPAAPEQRIVRGAGPQANQQRDAAQAEYKAAREAHLALTKTVRELPEEFTEPAPEVVYAIYMAPDRTPNFALAGDAPFPWTVKTSEFETLRGLATQNANEQALTDALEWLTSDTQPFSLHVSAALLASGTNLAQVKPDSILMPVVMRIVNEGDSFDRLLLVKAIAQNNQSVPVAGTILNTIMRDKDPATALMALRARAGDAQRQRDALKDEDLTLFADTTQRLLVTEDAAEVGDVLTPAFDLAKQNEPARDVLASKLDVKPLKGPRLEGLVRIVVEKAKEKDLLALMLLDTQLLGNGDVEVTKLTLGRILGDSSQPSQAPQGPSLLSRLGGSLGLGGTKPATPGAAPQPAAPTPPQPQPQRPSATPFSVFDRLEALNAPPNPQPQPGFPGGPGFPSPGGYGQPQPQQPKGPDPIEINRPGHGMVLALQSKDAPTRELAWKALPLFAIGQPTQRNTDEKNKVTVQDIYASLAQSAAGVDPTPVQIVTFLEQQKETAGVEAAYRTLMTEGKGEVRLLALQRFASGNNANLARVLGEMTGDERVKVVSLWYESASKQAPLVVGLLHQSEADGKPGQVASKLLQWLSQKMAADTRPADDEWAQNVGGPQVLIPGLGDKDEAYALGCAAALWSSALPATPEMAQQLHRKAGEVMRSVADPNEGHKQIETEWNTLRDTAIKAYLESAKGRYTLQVAAQAKPQNTPQAGYTPGQFPGPFPQPGPGFAPGRTPGAAAVGQSTARPINRKVEVELAFEEGGKVSLAPYDIAGQLVQQSVRIQFLNSSQLLNPKAAEPPPEAPQPPSVPGAPGAAPANPFPGPPGGFPAGPGVSSGQPVELSPVADGRWEGTTTLQDQRVLTVVLTRITE